MKKELQSQGKREKHIDYDVTSHIRDVNGHEIFKNNRLTSQFLSNIQEFRCWLECDRKISKT